eukprot:Hpha_TRINITY_DN15295_c3_g5::TRINITY_DN15295_c3_g5_i1::g.68443::m.68443
MRSRALPILALLVCNGAWAVEGAPRCKPGDECWPSSAEIAELESQLDPSAKRILEWKGNPSPRVSAFPTGSPGDQPLYGLGETPMKPLYVRQASDQEHQCYDLIGKDEYFAPEFCNASVRNNPLEKWSPAFVAWPLTAKHVQEAVRFAVKHNLCISVAGTGHDFLNRHSCPDGIFIRTSLMKDIDWDLTDSRGYGWAPGNVQLGPGIIFDEAHASASKNNRVVASGWAATVGVIGWSIGGGHGPHGNQCGLGVDNVLSADIVLADGSLVTANATSHSDLYFALRGGGGSTWGVITSITIRAHHIPAGGFTILSATWGSGLFTNPQRFYDIHSQWMEWSKTLDSNWSGLTFFGTGKNALGRPTWYVYLLYVYYGSNTSAAFIDRAEAIQALKPDIVSDQNFATFTDVIHAQFKDQDPINPVPWLPPSAASVGGLGSVLVSRENATRSLAMLPQVFAACKDYGACSRLEYYQAITGNKGSKQADNVSISPAFRTALYHLVFSPPDKATLKGVFELVGSDNAYFNESPYTLDDPAQTYWGDNARRLQETKNKYDSGNVFGCHNCVTAQGK